MGQPLPGEGKTADGRVAEAKHDSKERVEVLLLFEVRSQLDELSEQLSPKTRYRT